MLDRVDAPPFLIEHLIVDDAPDRELAVLLDGIILQVLIAAVAIHEQPPVRIALANIGEQREVHRGTFDIERFVVFDYADGAEWIQRARGDIDGLAEHLEMSSAQKFMRLLHVLALRIHRQRECLQPRRRSSLVQEQLVQAEQDRAAVDAPGKRNADRRGGVLRDEPSTQLIVNGLDVMAANEIQIPGQRGARRIEEAPVYRIGVRTSNQTQRRDMVRWNHSRITRVELTRPSPARQLRGDRVDPLGHDQYRSIDRFCEKVAQRTVEAARQHDSLAILRNECKGSFETEYCVEVAG